MLPFLILSCPFRHVVGEKALMDHNAAMALDSLQLFQGCVLGLLHQHGGYLVSSRDRNPTLIIGVSEHGLFGCTCVGDTS